MFLKLEAVVLNATDEINRMWTVIELPSSNRGFFHTFSALGGLSIPWWAATRDKHYAIG
jgi:hypothetical protein